MAFGIQNELLTAYSQAAKQIAERRRPGGEPGNNTRDRLKEIRRRLNMSQAEFAECFSIAFSTVKNWEQEGRGEPQGLADIYIKMIDADPDSVIKLLEKVRDKESHGNFIES